jgi:hypothetical protein
VHHAHCAGLSGPVQWVADLFRWHFEIFFDGMTTGQLGEPTAIEMMAVMGGSTNYTTLRLRLIG